MAAILSTMASSQVQKVSTTATLPTIKSGQPPVTLSINLKYKQRLLNEEQTFTLLPLVVNIPLDALLSFFACKNYLMLKLSGLSVDSRVGEEVALKIARAVVEEAGNKLKRVAGCGISMEADVEILWDQNGVAERMKLREMAPEDGDGIAMRSEECVVCLEGLSGAGKLIQTPCSHVFHKFCIFTWLEKKGTCPMCRSKIS